MKQEWPSLSYASRNVNVKTHSKASNLNFGLGHLQSLEGAQAPYVAVLDADMIPEPMWLRCVLPHVLDNPRAALACPTQRYYNLPRGDALGVLSDLLPIECMMRPQDFSNNSWCTGSGFVVNSSALETIGCFPEDSLQEDALTSNYLSAAGWCSLFVPGSLQWGRGPDTMAAYLKQSQRWAVGIISVAQFVRSGKAKKLPREVRLNLTLWGVVMGAASFIWTFALVALPLCVMNGKPLIVPSQQASHLRWLMRLATLDFCTRTLYHTLMSSVVDFRMPIYGLFTSIWTQPWRASIVLRYFVIPKLLGRDPPNFTPTGISADGEAERAARAHGSRLACCKLVLWDCGAWIPSHHFAVQYGRCRYLARCGTRGLLLQQGRLQCGLGNSERYRMATCSPPVGRSYRSRMATRFLRNLAPFIVRSRHSDGSGFKARCGLPF